MLTERSDLFVLDDPKPGLLDLQGLASEGNRRITSALRRRVRHTRFARRQALGRLNDRAANARSILVICKGNICRSPFASEYLRRFLPARVTVTSAGYYPKALRRSPSEAVAAADRLGIDLSNHRSTVLDDQMVASADLILVFDDENYDRVLHDYPKAADRLFYVGSLSEGKELAIPDPWGGDADTFDRCYTSIRAALDRLVPVFEPGSDTPPPAAAPLYRTIEAGTQEGAH